MFRYSPPTVCHPACGTLSPSAFMLQQQRFTDPSSEVGLCGTTLGPESVKNKLKMCDLLYDVWLPWRCVGGRERRQGESEWFTWGCINATLLTTAFSDVLMFAHSLPPPTALSLCTVRLLWACCANLSKLLHIQVLTCSNSSITRFMRQRSKPTPHDPNTELLWRIQKEKWEHLNHTHH